MGHVEVLVAAQLEVEPSVLAFLALSLGVATVSMRPLATQEGLVTLCLATEVPLLLSETILKGLCLHPQ